MLPQSAAPTDVLLLSAVTYAYPGSLHPILDIERLTVQAGERVLLQGSSGCGKSTLLSLAAGVLMPDHGQASLLGVPWQQLRSGQRDARRVDHVGYIFQQFNLLPYLSVIDNVLLPCRFSRLRAERAQRGDGSLTLAAQTLLDALELPSAVWRREASALSVGQQQRVAAARALIGDPEVVIADEPTSALDEERRDGFMQLLTSQCERHHSALLFVSHDRRLAPHFSRVVDLPSLNRARVRESLAEPV